REPVLLKELQNVQVATRTFEWRTQIWFPGKYFVKRSFQGESEVIPTVLALSPTSITTPRSDPNQPVYLLEKQVIRTTTTRVGPFGGGLISYIGHGLGPATRYLYLQYGFLCVHL
ncbi:hypothetical protein Anas_10998, partial [Armadillidium nasatum]